MGFVLERVPSDVQYTPESVTVAFFFDVKLYAIRPITKTASASKRYFFILHAKYTPRGYTVSMRQDIKKKAARRLKIIEGQIRGIQKMVEDEKYCIDIITQSSAIKEALSGVENLILENHISTHVIQQIKGGKEKQAITEILKVYRRAQKK